MPGFAGGDFREFWADVKTPGDGWAYSVGSIEVGDTGVSGPVFFSGSQATLPSAAMSAFATGAGTGGAPRQVVMLQQAGVADDSIGFQRFFYGSNPTAPPNTWRATNARAIAVWPDATAVESRIVICGETFDELLPLSNAPAGWPAAGMGLPIGSSGFLAVFNGDGDLLWTHHFFGQGSARHCAITDVSVRVEWDNTGQPHDVVTFCGLSSYGNPAANATLTTVVPFAAPTSGAGSLCPNSTGGATDNGPDQFDGIVGRLRRPHTSAVPAGGTTSVEFLSVVGGVRADALFGLAEIDAQRFAVVGSTGGQASGVGTGTFPVTLAPVACPNQGIEQNGVLCVFRTDPAGLVLEASQTFGSSSPGTDTAAKDVLMQRFWGPNQEPGLIVVGATSDPLLFDAYASLGPYIPLVPGPDTSLGGPLDGFILACEYDPLASLPVLLWTHGTYQGSDEFDFLTGVQGWNEFYDHFVVCGTVGRVGGTGNSFSNIAVTGYYRQPSLGTSGGLPVRTPLALLREVEIGGLDRDEPATLGNDNATDMAMLGVGPSSGGGIAVDPTGRACVVGSTFVQPLMIFPLNVSSFPVTTGPNDPPGRASTGNWNDAVRATFDLLPSDAAMGSVVGRTDGTGPSQLPPGGPASGYPVTGSFGGTTPQCALTGFGHQIGYSDPQVLPATPRMLIDWEGPPPGPGTSFSLVVSRHPRQTASALSIVALQLGFPGTGSFDPAPLPGGAELWVPQYSISWLAAPNSYWESIRYPMTLPNPSLGPISIQVVCLLIAPVSGGTFPACTSTSLYAATPGLWLNY